MKARVQIAHATVQHDMACPRVISSPDGQTGPVVRSRRLTRHRPSPGWTLCAAADCIARCSVGVSGLQRERERTAA